MRLLILLIFISTNIFAQLNKYDSSKDHPFGKVNPNAPEQIKDYKDLIGECDCESIKRNKDNTWSEPETMLWRFKYIMNGMAIQDETFKSGGSYSGSIRQFNEETGKWYVHYYTSTVNPKSKQLPVWEGNMIDGKIILYREQKAPNGTEGFYKITFSEINEEGFNWLGEWVDNNETVSFPTWKISCVKKKD